MTSMSLADYRELFPVQKDKKRRSAKQGTRQPSEGDTVLATHLRACGIDFEQEYEFHPKRKWRADFLIIGAKILVEVEGCIWMAGGGRHTKGERLYRGHGKIQRSSNDGFYSFMVQYRASEVGRGN